MEIAARACNPIPKAALYVPVAALAVPEPAAKIPHVALQSPGPPLYANIVARGKSAISEPEAYNS
jgi:hypothetical protein